MILRSSKRQYDRSQGTRDSRSVDMGVYFIRRTARFSIQLTQNCPWVWLGSVRWKCFSLQWVGCVDVPKLSYIFYANYIKLAYIGSGT